ncbi:MAG: ABC transporter permease subunit, partial [Tepidisphaeraceae bacterium]
MPQLNTRSRHRLISLGLYAFFLLFFLWPIYRILVRGFVTRSGHFTLQYVGLVFSDPELVRGLLNAIAIAAGVTLLCLLISMPLAILSVGYEFPLRGLLGGLMLAPLVLPPFVGAIGVRLLLGRLGPLSVLAGYGQGAGFDWLGRYRALGIILIEVLHLYPVLLLNLQASLASVDPTMQQAAANLGAGRFTVFRRITLPLIRPGIFAGCTLTLIWSFTELGTPLMFGFNTITPVQIFEQVTDVADNPLPFALVVVTLGVAVGLYLVGKVLLGRSYETAATKASVAMTPKRLRGFWAILACLPFVLVLALALLPHLSVVLTSLSATGQWYRSILPQQFSSSHYLAALTDDLAMPSVANSAIYASLATAVALVVGLGVGIIAVRSRLPDRGVIDALAMLPLAVPGLVLAFGYLAISVTLKQKFGEKLPIWLNVQE